MLKAEKNQKTKCGFIAIIGSPNAGKSTLINQFVGEKISIVSQKVQTTRNRVLGIRINGDAQLVFIDTPGIFRPHRRLERAMVSAAWSGVREADRIALIVDANRGLDPNTNSIIFRLKNDGVCADLILNKVDIVHKSKLLKLAAQINNSEIFDKTFMISAMNSDGVDEVIQHFSQTLPNGPWIFPKDQISDMTDRLFSAEITREKIFKQLHKELPYATTVETENWQELENSSIRIGQTIYVQRESQKAIVLGKKGHQIKSIGMEARAELEKFFNCPVQLLLFVKVRENWIDDPERYNDWKLDFNV